MLEEGVALSADFRTLGQEISLIHGTSTCHYGNLSQLRNYDGMFEKRYPQYLKRLGLEVNDHVVISPVRHTANVAQIKRRGGFSGLRYVTHDDQQVKDINIFEGIAPPGMDDADYLLGFDAMVTDDPNIFLGLAHGDCTPLFLLFPYKGIVAMVHAGILGILGGIIENTFSSVKGWYDVSPCEAIAYIGPCISNNAYNVAKSGMWEPVLRHHMSEKEAVAFDLKKATREKLRSLGVNPAAIFESEFCTAIDRDLFFSNHMTPMSVKDKLGRNLSLIGRLR